MILDKLNLEKSYSKLIESSYVPYKGYWIEKIDNEYMVMDQRFNSVEKAKKAIDNKLKK